jgi:cell wall-associated NlpC family hydrolase
MQIRKVIGLAVPTLVFSFLAGQTPIQAAAPENKPVAAAKAKSVNPKSGKLKFDTSAVPVSAEAIQVAIAAALTKEDGARYRAGGTGPNSFDCSGLVLWAYEQVGVSLPHGTRSILPIVMPISREDLLPGDLVFSGRSGSGIQHVALYIGDNKVIHATYASASRANQVRIDDLDGSWVMVHKAYGRVVQ